VQGATERGSYVFKGIPYATPPVVSLRWKPPKGAANVWAVRLQSNFMKARLNVYLASGKPLSRLTGRK